MLNHETVRKHHEQILTFLNARLSESFKFYVPVLAAAAGFGSSLASNSGLDILSAAYIISVILLCGEMAYIFATSYTYRNFQITLEQAEKYIGLSRLTCTWRITPKLDKSWWENRLWLTPEILQPQLWLLVFTFYLITLGYFGHPYTTTFFTDQTSKNLIVAALLTPLILVVLLDLHYYRKLKDHIRKELIAWGAYELYGKRGR